MTQQRKSELDASLRRLAKNDPRLRELSLSWTGIGDWGLEALSDVLKVNTVLTSLDLYHNDIGPRGAGALARALWRNRTLIDVNLDSNNIGDEGVGDFIYTMEKHNTTLTNLKVQNNHVDQIKLRDLNDLLERNTAHKASALGQGFKGTHAHLARCADWLTTCGCRLTGIGTLARTRYAASQLQRRIARPSQRAHVTAEAPIPSLDPAAQAHAP
jgi:hypothetical protein